MVKDFDLNSSQKTAVEHYLGALIVVAGAGTGKTRVIVERVKYLISHKKLDSDSILALTFTEKAANEMLERIGDVMPLGYKEPWVSTFHSFADRILRKEGLEIGLDTGYEILTYPKQWLLVRKNLFNFKLDYYRPLGNPTKFISAILKFISRLQDEGVGCEDFSAYANSIEQEDERIRWQELANFYNDYQSLKIQNSKMDFGDLITWCQTLFDGRPQILKKYQNQFVHIMVDEFQDTNFAQYRLIKTLFPLREEKRSLMVVGDDSQSIYKFRGAAISNILEFMQDYKNSRMVSLIKNYRSGQKILDSAYNLIQNNNPDTLEAKLNINKKLESVSKKSNISPECVELLALEDEVNYVISKIEEILSQRPDISYKDIAILARANNHLDPFVLALRAKGIPYQLIGNRGLYDKEEIKDVLAILRVLLDVKDGVSLYRVISNPIFSVPLPEVTKIMSTARFRKIDLWESIKLSTHTSVLNLISNIEGYRKNLLVFSPSVFIYKLISESGILESYTKIENAENLLSIKNLDLFLKEAKHFEKDYYRDRKTTPNILDYVEFLDLMIEAGDNPPQAEIEDIDTVNLSTVHSAKGLEYEAVFVVNLVAGRLPSRQRGDPIEIPDDLIKETLPTGDFHLQEERRLFYVAMTRAKNYLLLTYSRNYGGKRDTNVSGFIAETGIKVGDSVVTPNLAKNLSIFGINSLYRNSTNSTAAFHLDYVNYTQISTYQTCPLKYKYGFVIRIPTPPSHALTFGTTIHGTLRDYYEEKRHKKEVSLDRLLEIYIKNWDDSGYIDDKHRKQRFSSGQKLLKQYYAQESKSVSTVLEIEKSINLKLAGVKFSGRVDRIDQIQGNDVEIIDYKTGKVKEQKDVEKDLQTSLYAWGVREALNLEPKVLTLYFLEEPQKISFQKSLEEIKEQVALAEEVVNIMKKGNFTATPGKHCEWCDYKGICPFVQKGF